MAAPKRARPKYVPDAGDIVWLAFNPQAGHEQAGHRPAVVLSPASYNGRTGLLLCCPTTTQIKNYPFEVRLSGTKPSAALADQIKSLDWQARRATRKGHAISAELDEIRQKAIALLRG
jgi:mRNA interferase MazF